MEMYSWVPACVHMNVTTVCVRRWLWTDTVSVLNKMTRAHEPQLCRYTGSGIFVLHSQHTLSGSIGRRSCFELITNPAEVNGWLSFFFLFKNGHCYRQTKKKWQEGWDVLRKYKIQRKGRSRWNIKQENEGCLQSRRLIYWNNTALILYFTTAVHHYK